MGCATMTDSRRLHCSIRFVLFAATVLIAIAFGRDAAAGPDLAPKTR